MACKARRTERELRGEALRIGEIEFVTGQPQIVTVVRAEHQTMIEQPDRIAVGIFGRMHDADACHVPPLRYLSHRFSADYGTGDAPRVESVVAA